MKKLLSIMGFLVVVLALSAQVTKTPVKVADLPKAITDNIAKDYAGFMIKEATMVTENNTVTYDILINKGTESQTLVYDKDGKCLKKMAPTAETSPADKPAEKAPPMK